MLFLVQCCASTVYRVGAQAFRVLVWGFWGAEGFMALRSAW